MFDVVTFFRNVNIPSPNPFHNTPIELDLDDCYGNIPKDLVITSLEFFHCKFLSSSQYFLVTTTALIPTDKKKGSVKWSSFLDAIKFELYCNCVISIGTTNFVQNRGLPMGGWLSGFLQEIYCTYCEMTQFDITLSNLMVVKVGVNLYIHQGIALYLDFTRFKDNIYIITDDVYIDSLLLPFVKALYGIPCKVEGGYPNNFRPLNLITRFSGSSFSSLVIDTWSFTVAQSQVSLRTHKTPWHDQTHDTIHSLVQGSLHRCVQYSLTCNDAYTNVMNCIKSFWITGTPGSVLKEELTFASKAGIHDLHKACVLALMDLHCVGETFLHL